MIHNPLKSVIGYRLSVIGYRLSVIGYRLSYYYALILSSNKFSNTSQIYANYSKFDSLPVSLNDWRLQTC